jgi:ATP-binding cassette subfamily B (MDR/TAP) protein 1
VLGFIFCDAVTTCASLVVALYFSWRLALVLLATLPVSFVILALVARNLDSAVWKQKQYLQKASTLAAAAFNGIDLVTVFGGCDTEVSKYASALRLAARHFLAQVQSNSIQRGYVAFWSISIFVLGFWYGLVLVQQGTSPGNIITTFHAILTAFQCAESFARHWLILSKGKGAGHFLANLARLEPTFDDHSGEDVENPVDECNGDVRLDKVCVCRWMTIAMWLIFVLIASAGQFFLSIKPEQGFPERSIIAFSSKQNELLGWGQWIREKHSLCSNCGPSCAD